MNNKFITEQIKLGADKQVIKFIDKLLYHNGKDYYDVESIIHLFKEGYCYYFAHMLQTAFHRGTVCWAAPNGHFIWCDTDNTPYDIEGLYFGEAKEFIPEQYLGDMIYDFLHIPGVEHNTTDTEIKACIERYRKDKQQ